MLAEIRSIVRDEDEIVLARVRPAPVLQLPTRRVGNSAFDQSFAIGCALHSQPFSLPSSLIRANLTSDSGL
jgi:hypothetical protein